MFIKLLPNWLTVSPKSLRSRPIRALLSPPAGVAPDLLVSAPAPPLLRCVLAGATALPHRALDPPRHAAAVGLHARASGCLRAPPSSARRGCALAMAVRNPDEQGSAAPPAPPARAAPPTSSPCARPTAAGGEERKRGGKRNEARVSRGAGRQVVLSPDVCVQRRPIVIQWLTGVGYHHGPRRPRGVQHIPAPGPGF
ncbi:hypothetical protein PVAP13_6NG190209 [Panicum virgatum]|uniref:Uncharacterized protein n=1 Tax=Panicum virgatum TaxID=38727 RepID=A0A8T0QXR8_PANVG|nr:hypothetical protein PVAP13_6NG190209 [Panicum virgatum]